MEQGLGAQQHLAMWIAGATVKNRRLCQESNWMRLLKHAAVILIVRIRYALQVGGVPQTIGFALGECNYGSRSIDIMDGDFFDESLLVIAFRSQEDGMGLR